MHRTPSLPSTLLVFLAIGGLPSFALAKNYECHLPLVTTSDLENGIPRTKTSHDKFAEAGFSISVSGDGESAILDGVRFGAAKGPGYLTFYGMAQGMSAGFDILTIYDARIGKGQFAVESRVLTILGKPIASQMVGTCVAVGG